MNICIPRWQTIVILSRYIKFLCFLVLTRRGRRTFVGQVGPGWDRQSVWLFSLPACVSVVTNNSIPFTIPCGPCGLTIIPAWINNHIPSKVWNEITYQFPNLEANTVYPANMYKVLCYFPGNKKCQDWSTLQKLKHCLKHENKVNGNKVLSYCKALWCATIKKKLFPLCQTYKPTIILN